MMTRCVQNGPAVRPWPDERGRGRPRHNVERASPPVRLSKTAWKCPNSRVRPWADGPSRTGRSDEGAYLNGYVTEEQRSRRPIFIGTLRAARLLTGCFVAHRSKTAAGILPLRFAHPAKIRSSAAIPATDLVH